MEDKRNSASGFDEFSELDLTSYDDTDYADNAEDKSDAKANKKSFAFNKKSAKSDDSDAEGEALFAKQTSEQKVAYADQDSKSDEDDDDEEVAIAYDDQSLASEFDSMEKVVYINGMKRKERKCRRKLGKQGKLILNGAITCVCLGIFIAIAVIAGPLIISILFAKESKQGLDSTELIVDMTDTEYHFGTEGAIDLTKTFKNATSFELVDDGGIATKKGANVLEVSGEGTFTLSYVSTLEGASTDPIEVSCVGVQDAVNITDWDNFRKCIAEEKVVVLHDNVESPELQGLKRKDHPVLTVKNHIYGNGKTVNLFELVCSRQKASNKIFGEPYLPGNGKVGGSTGISVESNDNGTRIDLVNLHVTGNNMSTYDPSVSTEGSGEGEGAAAPTADEAGDKKPGNMPAGKISAETIENRGVKLFSRYGSLVDLSGTVEAQVPVLIKHCVIENGAKVLHVEAADLELEGSIIRNAADTAISVATYANKGSYILSRNNVVANSLTGGILFYCFDDKIDASNAKATWNTLEIEEGSFLDIYNWKAEKGLAFLPETEGFADIANPIAGTEIPKTQYDALKGKDAEGNKYIHFAIIKIRTGGGLPQNGSQVIGAENIGYTTSRQNGFEKGFPIPSIAGAIMKELEVWGYYGNDGNKTGQICDVWPTDSIGGLHHSATEETEGKMDMALFYKELRDGRQAGTTTPTK